MLSINKVLDDNRPDWVLNEVIPLLNRFPHTDDVASAVTAYIAKHIQPGGRVVYPLTGVVDSKIPIVGKLRAKFAELNIELMAKNVEYVPPEHRNNSAYGIYNNPKDVVLAPRVAEALQGMDPSIKVYRLLMDLLMDTMYVECTASLESVFDSIYVKFIQSRGLILDARCLDAYASIYKAVLCNLFDYRKVMLNIIGIDIDMCSERHFRQVIDKYFDLVKVLLGYDTSRERNYETLLEAMAYEKVIVWTFLGNVDSYPGNIINLTVAFYRAGGSTTAFDASHIDADSSDRANALITGADSDIDFGLAVNDVSCVIPCEVCAVKHIHDIVPSDIANWFKGSIGYTLTEESISFELDEPQKAMMVSECNISNFSVLICPRKGIKYVYKDGADTYLLFKSKKPTGITDDAVYGVSLDLNTEGKRSAIAIQGDARHNYVYRYHT